MTTIQRFDPFREMLHLRRAYHPAFPAPGWRGFDATNGQRAGGFAVNVRRDDEKLTLLAWLPGIEPEDVDVTIGPDQELTIKAFRKLREQGPNERYLMREHRFRQGQRSIRLPGDLDLDAAAVSLEHGVLTVTVPVAETSQTRRLHVAGSPAAE